MLTKLLIKPSFTNLSGPVCIFLRYFLINKERMQSTSASLKILPEWLFHFYDQISLKKK